MKVEIREEPSRRVAYLRGHGRYPDVFPKLWPRFKTLASPLKLFNSGRAVMSIMHDKMGTVPDEQLRADAAIEVDANWNPQGGLDVETIPGGLFAMTEHQGPYSGLRDTWGEFYNRWLATSGYQLRPAPFYEIYVNDPQTTAPPDLRTAIYVPVEKV